MADTSVAGNVVAVVVAKTMTIYNGSKMFQVRAFQGSSCTQHGRFR